MREKRLALFAVLLVAGCSAGTAEVERELARRLGTSFEGQVTVLDSSYSFAIGEGVTTVEARFTEEGLKRLMSVAPPYAWKTTEKGSQLVRTMQNSDFIAISVAPPSPIVHIQYGDD